MDIKQAARNYWKSRQEENNVERQILQCLKSKHPLMVDEIAQREKCAQCIKERLGLF